MRVFISHSENDSRFADEMRDALTRHDLNVWNPDRELFPGDNWLLKAGRALEKADAVVILMSSDFIDSPVAKREIQYVITQPKFENRVFPVRVGTGVGKIPWFFRDLIIDASPEDAEKTATEIATRLKSRQPRKQTAGQRKNRRLSTTPSGTPTAKSVKQTARRVRVG